MTKKQTKVNLEEQQRRSRKEVLMARKEKEQKRSIYIGVGIVGGILLVLLLIALANELFIAPNRAVSEVSGEKITLSDWQDRVRFERAQRILLLETQLASFGDIGLIQQFYGQVIQELLTPEQMGANVLNEMANDIIVLQEARARGITVTDEEVDEAIGESFNYFGGESPTPMPTPTATIMPTPSITPIPTAVITDAVPTNTPFPTPTLGPTNPPPPTPTAVSAEAFQTEYEDLLAQYAALGITEAQYRDFVRLQLYREKLADALAVANNMPTETEQASFFFMAFDTEEQANDALADVTAEGFLPVWNELRSRPFDPEAASNPVVSEMLWRTRAEIEQSFGIETAAAVFALPVNEASGLLMQEVDEETSRYYLVMVSGRELRPLTESAINQAKQQELASFLDSRLTGNQTTYDFYLDRAPETPRLDPIFYTPVTPTPAAPVPELPLPGSSDQ